MENRTYFDLLDTSWTLLFNNTNDEAKSIYVNSKALIDIYVSDTAVADFTNITKLNYVTIGGTLNSYNVAAGKYVYVKSAQAPCQGFYLPQGQADPDKDISTVTTAIQELIEQHDNHVENVNDPHQVTKEQVDLGNLVNRISEVINESPDGALATDRAIKALFDLLKLHTDSRVNPHIVTKTQLLLQNVMNYPVATEEADILNTTNDTMYASIKAVFDILANREEKTSVSQANQVLSGDLEDQTEADRLLYDPMSETVVLDGANIVVKAGLVVSYSDNGIIKLSNELTLDIPLAMSSVSTEINPKPGVHYLYVDTAEDNGAIISVGTNYNRPHIGVRASSDLADLDFIHQATGQVYNPDGNKIRRVYISKVYVDENGFVTDVLNVPQANVITMKIDDLIEPDITMIIDNPFYEPITVYPEIKLGDQWANPMFFDQAGVKATWQKDNPDVITVQSGALGIAAPAVNSGSAFTTENLNSTYSGSASLRLIIARM